MYPGYAMEEIKESTFKSDVLEADKPVVVDFWAPWCGPCRRFAPILEEVATELGDEVKVVKLNTDESPAIAGQYGVMSIPTLVMFKNGAEVGRIVGVVNKEQLKDRITSAVK